jgi:S-adenosylmethionine:tRNA-ribosyltransferase-isomerase (queuine synthetase)
VNLPDAIKHSNFSVVNETLVLDARFENGALMGSSVRIFLGANTAVLENAATAH